MVDDEIENDRNYQMLKEHLERYGVVNHASKGPTGEIVFDFYLGEKDTDPLEMINNGEFGSSILYNSASQVIKKARMRMGEANPGPEADQFIVVGRFSQLVTESRPPMDNVDTDLGDFDQGILHLRMDGRCGVEQFIQFHERLEAKMDSREDWMRGRDL